MSGCNITPGCFWEDACKTLFLLKTKDGDGSFFILLLEINSWACLHGFGLKLTFHWKANLLIFFWSSFNSLAEAFKSRIIENKDVSSAKRFTLEYKSSAKSMIWIKNNSAPRIDSCRTLAWTLIKDEFCLLNATLCSLLLKIR